MIFVYKYWEQFCKKLDEKGIHSIPACEINGEEKSFLVLKHDIENSVSRAFKMAEIEKKYGQRGSYYAHAYLLENLKNVEMLKEMQKMGHEISYHYDVMDSSHGNMKQAISEFEKNKLLFEGLGFKLITVCQHGNPVIERVGYTSNRDFFRSEYVQSLYPEISDIMVNYKGKHNTEYTYYSDAGRKFCLIFDPINNDIVDSEDKNIAYKDLNELFDNLEAKAIISTHPHRWTNSECSYLIKERLFKIIKYIAKKLMRVPMLKKIMSRYYYLAKKI